MCAAIPSRDSASSMQQLVGGDRFNSSGDSESSADLLARFRNGYSPRAEEEQAAAALHHQQFEPQSSLDFSESPIAEDVELQIIMPTKQADKLKAAEAEIEGYDDEDDENVCCPCCPGFNPGAAFKRGIAAAQIYIAEFLEKHRKVITIVLSLLFLVVYLSYFSFAVYSDHRRALPLIVLTALVTLAMLYSVITRMCGECISNNVIIPVCSGIDRVWPVMRWIIYGCLVLVVALYITVEVDPHPRQLISLLGMVLFLTLTFLCSKYPDKVNMRPVVWGLGLQFAFGILILRTKWGLAMFHWIGQRVQMFLGFTDEGARFVFGEEYLEHFFAFKVLSVVVFFSSFISILYHLGIMQIAVQKIAWLMQKTMQTAATESMIAASNIFIGQAEAPILVKPYLSSMTKSELHAMMTAGFATIAGGVMAAYIMFGIPAEHLICASVMNAPIALAVSKLSYPETEKKKNGKSTVIQLQKGTDRNILEAAASGASSSISLVANIAANLIAFLALLAFVNAIISWMGSLVDHPEWTFQMGMSYLFMPIAFLMGVDWNDCSHVGELLGIKIFLNEFVAYKQLGILMHNRELGIEPMISERSETIATYSLCGFANLSSIAIQLGGIGPMAPERRPHLAEMAVRALVAGTTACFITACMAGVLTVEKVFSPCPPNSTLYNSTVCVMFAISPFNISSVNSTML